MISRGLVWEGVRASGSIPVLFTAAKREGRYLVDGALVNPVPVSVLRAMGADFIIAVNVIPRQSTEETREPNILSIMMQMLHIASYRIIQNCLTGADIIIEPRLEHIAVGDFHKVEECILQGSLATEKAIPEIRRRYSA